MKAELLLTSEERCLCKIAGQGHEPNQQFSCCDGTNKETARISVVHVLFLLPFPVSIVSL